MNAHRVGIVGAGIISSTIHIPLLQAMPNVAIAWIADVVDQKAQRAARHISTRALSSGETMSADFVLLAVPLPPRNALLAKLADSDSVILVEKPLANTLKDHDEIISMFPEWRVAVGYQRRYYAQYRLMKHFINNGIFGPLRRIIHSEGGRTMRSGGGGHYHTAPLSQGGGIVKNLGCHALDLAMWLTGADIFEIRNNQLTMDDGADLACHATIELPLASGGSCAFEFSASWLDKQQNTMEFVFDHVRLRCAVSPSDHIDLMSDNGSPLTTISATGQGAVSSTQAFYLEWMDVIAAGEKKIAQPISAVSSRPSAAVMSALLSEDKWSS